MFIKRKPRARKASAYRMLLSIKTLVTYKKMFLTSRWTTVSIVKQLSFPEIVSCPVITFRLVKNQSVSSILDKIEDQNLSGNLEKLESIGKFFLKKITCLQTFQ